MTLKLAINGFGRIGRNVMRAILERDEADIEVVAINDLTDLENLAYLFKYDSVHGKFAGDVTVGDGTLDFGKGPIKISAERDPSALDWKGVDITLECTGFFTARDKAEAHLKNGSKKVLISAPGKGVDQTVVYGVNHDVLSANDIIVSNASCTTNCLAPIAKALNDAFEIKDGLLTTVHAYTGSQPTLDRGASKFARGRAAALSMVPTTTGAAKAVGLVLPELDGKLDGVAIRVPTPNVSCVDLKFTAKKPLSVEAINDALSKASAQNPDVVGITIEPLVSIDLNHDPRSSIADLNETQLQGEMGRVLAWYDNEWGFSNRMIDTAKAMYAAK